MNEIITHAHDFIIRTFFSSEGQQKKKEEEKRKGKKKGKKKEGANVVTNLLWLTAKWLPR